MNLRTLILLSLALNLALGAVVLRRAPHSVAPAPTRPAAMVAPVITNAPVEVTVSAPVPAAFDWSQLAASDLKKYRDNLRAVGCPELTVRDIITSEVNAQFMERRRALVADLQRRFWDLLAANRELMEGKEWKQPLIKLNEEREALLAEVLGDAPEQPEAEQEASFRRNLERKYVWLPTEKRAQLIALEMEFRTRQQALHTEVRQRADTKWTDADKARQKALTAEMETQRERLLTSEELAEFKLRNSSAANWARNLNGFEASEAEWRAVATRRMEYDAALKKLAKNTTSKVRTQMEQEMQQEWQAQLQATLGAERYAAYTLAQDGRYQQTRRITQRYGLADSVAAQTFEMQKAAQDAASQLRKDQTLDSAARQAALTAIQKETQQSLEATLGPKVFSTYQKYNGDWLKKLNPPPEE